MIEAFEEKNLELAEFLLDTGIKQIIDINNYSNVYESYRGVYKNSIYIALSCSKMSITEKILKAVNNDIAERNIDVNTWVDNAFWDIRVGKKSNFDSKHILEVIKLFKAFNYPFPKTLLSDVISLKDIEIVKYIVEELKYDINYKNDIQQNITALTSTLKHGCEDIFDYLIEKGIDYKNTDKDGKNLLDALISIYNPNFYIYEKLKDLGLTHDKQLSVEKLKKFNVPFKANRNPLEIIKILNEENPEFAPDDLLEKFKTDKNGYLVSEAHVQYEQWNLLASRQVKSLLELTIKITASKEHIKYFGKEAYNKLISADDYTLPTELKELLIEATGNILDTID